MLNIHQLSKTYPDGTQALQDINLNFPIGMVGLLGPNGAGKSSLMRTLACLQVADEGEAIFNDISLEQSPDALRKVLGYLPQDFGVYPHMSCVALLEHIAVLKGLDATTRAQKIPYLLELTNLQAHANRRVSKFSGGMKQRFGIAQALLNDPKLLILDEPTAGLDPMERERFHDILVSLSKDRLILLSTHIVEDVENLCTHVALMINGRIVQNNTPIELIKSLENCIWQVPLNVTLSSDAEHLYKTFQYGKPALRVYSLIAPCAEAILCRPSLQDRYFYELKQAGVAYAVA